MAPQATTKSATPRHKNDKAKSPDKIKSKYWSNDDKSANVHSDLPWPKKRRSDKRSTSHEPGQMRLKSLPAGGTTTVANKEQYKRKFGDAFDFRPKTAPGIKEEPQEENVVKTPATLTRHFATSKSGQPTTAKSGQFTTAKSGQPTAAKSGQPTTAPKTTPLASKRDELAGPSKETATDLSERSAVITTLAYVHDGAVTEAVTSLVLRWARDPAPSGQGDVYDATFIRSILDDLDVHRIDSDRRAEVTEMLARPLQRQLKTLRSSSESLLSCLASINTPQPSSPSSRNSRQAQ
jgi:hypothetical protein